MDINHIDNSALPVQNTQHQNRISSQEAEKLKKAAQSFESFFISMLFEKMQKTTGGGASPFGKGTSGEVYQQLFNQALGDKMAAQDSFGLSKMMMKHLQKQEESSIPKLLDPIDR